MKPRHIPLRTCAVCGEKGDKANLVRIVRGGSGEADIDLKGSRSGRGAYICKNEQCWGAAISGSRLNRVLGLMPSTLAKQQLVLYRDGMNGKERLDSR